MIFAEFNNSNSKLGLFVEDDGRVAYAYLTDAGTIVGDVWLYNRIETPLEPEWERRPPGDAPYLNPRGYVRDPLPFALPKETAQFSIQWFDDHTKRGARVFANSQLIAELLHGEKPGKSLAAAKAGPLANPL